MNKRMIAAYATQDGKARTIRAVNCNTIVNALDRKPKRVRGGAIKRLLARRNVAYNRIAMLTAVHTIRGGKHKALCHLAQNGSYHYLGLRCPMPMTAIMKINDTNMDLTECRRNYRENPSDEQLIEFLKATDARIRKGTPREYFRLMDVDDEDIDKIEQAVPPKTQRYKLAGNSIVVACMYYIFESLFYGADDAEPQQLTLKF